jgi:uncharacterized protein
MEIDTVVPDLRADGGVQRSASDNLLPANTVWQNNVINGQPTDGYDFKYETVATMSVVANSVRQAASVPIGINVLANAGEAAIAAAKASGALFIRVNQWVNAYVSNEGIVQGNSARILRYRSTLQAQGVAIFADVHVKHGAHAIVADRPVEEQARDVEFFDADVAIATGNHTGDATPIEEIENIRRGTYLPVIIGSGLTVGNAFAMLEKADGAIVGTSLKENGAWWGRVSFRGCGLWSGKWGDFGKRRSCGSAGVME